MCIIYCVIYLGLCYLLCYLLTEKPFNGYYISSNIRIIVYYLLCYLLDFPLMCIIYCVIYSNTVLLCELFLELRGSAVLAKSHVSNVLTNS